MTVADEEPMTHEEFGYAVLRALSDVPRFPWRKVLWWSAPYVGTIVGVLVVRWLTHDWPF